MSTSPKEDAPGVASPDVDECVPIIGTITEEDPPGGASHAVEAVGSRGCAGDNPVGT
jgi:hypothetical protein